MRVLDDVDLNYIYGGSDSSTVNLSETETTLTTRAGIKDYSGWQSGGVGAALGNALYVWGKSFGWWH